MVYSCPRMRVPRTPIILTKSDIDRFMAKVRVAGAGECWNWKGSTQNGYGAFYVSGKQCRAHRVSYVIQHGSIPATGVIMHSCDNRLCVNPRHLSHGSQSENIKDATRKGRMVNPRFPGELSPKAVLSEEDVFGIRKDRSLGMSLNAMAAKWGVSKSAICHITSGRSWKHLV